MRNLTENEWRTLTVAAGAVVTYLLVQTDVPLEGWAKLVIGAANVVLIAISPSRLAGTR